MSKVNYRTYAKESTGGMDLEVVAGHMGVMSSPGAHATAPTTV
jgi:hypothetical protein